MSPTSKEKMQETRSVVYFPNPMIRQNCLTIGRCHTIKEAHSPQ